MEDTVASTIGCAVAALRAAGLSLRALSRFYATPSMPAGSGPDFVNAVALCRADLAPEEALERLHRIEQGFGRERSARWSARTLDLDLLAVGDAVRPDAATVRAWIDLPAAEQARRAPDRLILPHPRLQDRGFVLVPLCDVWPDWRHPLLGRTAREMLAARPAQEIRDIRPI